MLAFLESMSRKQREGFQGKCDKTLNSLSVMKVISSVRCVIVCIHLMESVNDMK
jgi:hypothetical protein